MPFSKDAVGHFLRSLDLSPISSQGRLTCATYSAACGVILQALGQDWAERHIGRTEKACDYFKAKKDDQQELLRYMARVTELGELIYNLHQVAGFEERLNTIRNDEKTGIESGIAELIAGKFFKLTNVLFQFVVVEKQPGQDTPTNPDIEYVAGYERVECCEVKCNLQSTDLSDRSIINILKKAKSQLPKGKAGIILLRVPETWFAVQEAGMRVIGKAVSDFIAAERTTRVSSVYVFVSETAFLPNDQMARVFKIKEFRNAFCQQGSGITIPDLTRGVSNWRNLEDVASHELGMTSGGIRLPPQ